MKLEMMWKEAAVANLRYYLGVCLEGLRKITKPSVRIAGVPAEMSSKHL
jgi:hypothetical protein